jgi:hypothetical protein
MRTLPQQRKQITLTVYQTVINSNCCNCELSVIVRAVVDEEPLHMVCNSAVPCDGYTNFVFDGNPEAVPVEFGVDDITFPLELDGGMIIDCDQFFGFARYFLRRPGTKLFEVIDSDRVVELYEYRANKEA